MLSTDSVAIENPFLTVPAAIIEKAKPQYKARPASIYMDIAHLTIFILTSLYLRTKRTNFKGRKVTYINSEVSRLYLKYATPGIIRAS